MWITASHRGVCLAEFAGTQRIERESRDLERLFQARTELGENEHTAQAARELTAYFRGERQTFSVALVPRAPISSDTSGRHYATFPSAQPPTIRRWRRLSANLPPCAPSPLPTAPTALPSSFPATASSARTARSPATAAAYSAKHGCSHMSAVSGTTRCRIYLPYTVRGRHSPTSDAPFLRAFQ